MVYHGQRLKKNLQWTSFFGGGYCVLKNQSNFTSYKLKLRKKQLGKLFKTAKPEVQESDDYLSGTALFGVKAEVTEILDDNRCKARVTGNDENLCRGEILLVTYEKINFTDEMNYMLVVGDSIYVTYSQFEKKSMNMS